MTDKEQMIKILVEAAAALPKAHFRGIPLDVFDKATLVLLATVMMEERDEARRKRYRMRLMMDRAYDFLTPENEP